MKKYSINNISMRLMLFLAMSLLVVMSSSPVLAQDDAEEDEKEVYKTRMSLSVLQFPDGTIELRGLLRARIGKSYERIPMKEIQFYSVEEEGAEKLLGKVETDATGVAVYNTSSKEVSLNQDGALSFIARFDGNDEMTGSDGDLAVMPARLKLNPVVDDSVYSLSIVAESNSGDSIVPVVDATVSIFIQRMFSSLKVGEGTTDEAGAVEIAFPADLPGDQDGNLMITARIDDTDEYGTLVADAKEAWGTPVSYEFTELPRALWSPHPPAWMVVTFFVLMTAVWAHYFFVIIELFRIKAIGKASQSA